MNWKEIALDNIGALLLGCIILCGLAAAMLLLWITASFVLGPQGYLLGLGLLAAFCFGKAFMLYHKQRQSH